MAVALPAAAEKAIHDFSIEAAVILGAPDPIAWAKLTREIARAWVEANPPTEKEIEMWGKVFDCEVNFSQWQDDGGR